MTLIYKIAVSSLGFLIFLSMLLAGTMVYNEINANDYNEMQSLSNSVKGSDTNIGRIHTQSEIDSELTGLKEEYSQQQDKIDNLVSDYDISDTTMDSINGASDNNLEVIDNLTNIAVLKDAQDIVNDSNVSISDGNVSEDIKNIQGSIAGVSDDVRESILDDNNIDVDSDGNLYVTEDSTVSYSDEDLEYVNENKEYMHNLVSDLNELANKEGYDVIVDDQSDAVINVEDGVLPATGF